MSNQKNILFVSVLLIFAILIGAFFVRPTLAGYSTYQQMKNFDKPIEEYVQTAKECDSNVLAIQSNLSSCNSFNDKLLGEFKEYSDKNSELESVLEDKTLAIDSLEKSLKENESALSSLEEKYKTLSYNSANNICCKMKIDNSRISFYEIVDDRVVCLESGTKRLNC